MTRLKGRGTHQINDLVLCASELAWIMCFLEPITERERWNALIGQVRVTCLYPALPPHGKGWGRKSALQSPGMGLQNPRSQEDRSGAISIWGSKCWAQNTVTTFDLTTFFFSHPRSPILCSDLSFLVLRNHHKLHVGTFVLYPGQGETPGYQYEGVCVMWRKHPVMLGRESGC